jgi:hypothetical protein
MLPWRLGVETVPPLRGAIPGRGYIGKPGDLIKGSDMSRFRIMPPGPYGLCGPGPWPGRPFGDGAFGEIGDG